MQGEGQGQKASTMSVTFNADDFEQDICMERRGAGNQDRFDQAFSEAFRQRMQSRVSKAMTPIVPAWATFHFTDLPHSYIHLPIL